jgi:hypothetical protein
MAVHRTRLFGLLVEREQSKSDVHRLFAPSRSTGGGDHVRPGSRCIVKRTTNTASKLRKHVGALGSGREQALEG